MAHKKGVGSSENGRDSKSKRLGIKLYGGQLATAGNIILRQRGSKYHLGDNVYQGKDWTIHAKVDGTVSYSKGRRNRTFVHIVPFGVEVQEKVATKAKAAPAKKQEPVKAAPAEETLVVETPVVEAAAPVVEKEAPKKAPKAAKEEKPKKAATGKDDFRKIEGIGPKIAGLLNDGGILTFAELASTDIEKIKGILEEAGSRYKMHDPTTWPKQANFAAEGKWDELKAWQDELKGGKE